MTLPFCLAALPLLTMDTGVVSTTDFIERIPAAEISTPEEYLAAHAPPPVEEEEEDAEAPSKKEETTTDNEMVPTEETPLLEKGEMLA